MWKKIVQAIAGREENRMQKVFHIILTIAIVIVMPIVFLINGGIFGGATAWLTLGIVYMIAAHSGKQLLFWMIVGLGTYGGAYWFTYCMPVFGIEQSISQTYSFYSLLSAMVTGGIGGVILKTYLRRFDEEHALNLLQKEELERSRDSKNVFFANISHEIRTPISTIIGLNEMILRANPTGEIKEYVQGIHAAGKLLLNQMDDILDLSQMEMKRMQIVPVNYSTEKLFRDLADLTRMKAVKKELDFCVDVDENIPAELCGDEKRIKQVLLNLLDNAVKYTDEGTVTLRVQGEKESADAILLKIQIVDTGIGIHKEDMEYIYDYFDRGDERRKTRSTGNGLGLSICKRLVELMGGEITIDSIYTKGTVFTIMLKQKIVKTEPVGVIDFLHAEEREDVYYQPYFEAPEARILVVDDNDMNLLVTQKLLADTKVQIDVAGGGEACLELTRKKFYHVIVLDYMMPGMSGEETLTAIRNQENGLCRDTAIITLTGNTMSGAREEYMGKGFDGYVKKPIQGRSLEKEICQFLPKDIIEYQEIKENEPAGSSQIQKITARKRKKVYITADCTCDIPSELLEKYDIRLMYLYIKTPHGRFADTREIDADSLAQYVTADSSTAYADSVTVEEFEEFFAETLTQAESVVHISLGSRAGKSHGIALTAAKGYDHVHVVDSGQISSGQALVVLHAAKLAMEGMDANRICAEVEKMRGRVQTAIVMPGVDIFYRNGRTGALTAKVCRALQLHPFLTMRQRNAVMLGFLWGTLENAWKVGIHFHLRRKRKINRDIVFISHVGCSVKQQEWIKKEVLKRVPFERVIIQKASFSVACNSGMETIGISYYSL